MKTLCLHISVRIVFLPIPAVAAHFPDAVFCFPSEFRKGFCGLIAFVRGRVAAQADGAPYLEEAVFAVNVYAADHASLEALARQTDQVLTALGLRRTHQQDFFDETAWAYRKYLRYRALLQGDTIYQ